ncbi:MAG TPA: 50S ribosomal protein L9 [Acholeplasmataceae bacterium]|jgi:ribosomal protein L9|nr:50S ribosomal protein L9 [Acholeplasmataceae bacterium]
MRNTLVYRIISLVLFLASCFVLVFTAIFGEINEWLTYAALVIVAASFTTVFVLNVGNKKFRKMQWLEQRYELWNSISYRVKKGGETAFNKLPIAIIVYDKNKTIQWANAYAKEIFLSPLVDVRIENISADLYYNLSNEDKFEISLYGSIFECEVLMEENIVYLTDVTEFHNLTQKYADHTLAAGIINLDNLNEALSGFDAQERSSQMSNIIGILSDWCSKFDIYLKGYTDNQYLILLNEKQLAEVVKDEFKVIDDVKSYCLKEDIRSSASIGIAVADNADLGYVELFALAETQLNLALNRGGNQCVLNKYGETSYFGGKTASFESRSPVYVRTKAEELVSLINKAQKIYVMTHIDADADAFGAAIAVQKIAAAYNKEAKIVFDLDRVDQTIQYLYSIIQREHTATLDYLIGTKKAIREIKSNDLLIIVDVQNQKILMEPKLYKKAKHVAVIDHHRPGKFLVDKYDYIYQTSSASSSVELLVEMYEFLDKDPIVSSAEATWMIMGILVDTNDLMYRASYRTFNVLSRLQTYGGELQLAKKYLREDYDKYEKRIDVLSNLMIYKEKYGIAVVIEGVNPRQFLAKVADDVLEIKGIKASFCVGRISENEIGISARSLDETNVQLIMEALGGGGHYNNAATQLRAVDLEEAKDMLIKEIDISEERGGDSMRIILTTEVKGKGKKGDIIDVKSGYGNFLIRSGQAIIASVDNIKELEKEKEKEKRLALSKENEMKDLRDKIEANPVTIGVKVGKEGKIFGSVSSKMIVDEYKAQYDITLDRKKIIKDEIQALGTFVVLVDLHPDVKARLTVYVVGKE